MNYEIKSIRELEEYYAYLDRKFAEEVQQILEEIYCGGID